MWRFDLITVSDGDAYLYASRSGDITIMFAFVVFFFFGLRALVRREVSVSKAYSLAALHGRHGRQAGFPPDSKKGRVGVISVVDE